MNQPIGGMIDIDVTLQPPHAPDVRITSTRAFELVRLFLKRPADEAPTLARSLFSVCGHAQHAAATHAISRARDIPLSRTQREGMALAVLAERCFETFRALLTSRTRGHLLATRRATLHHAAQDAALLTRLASMADGAEKRERVQRALASLDDAARGLGLPDEGRVPSRATVFETIYAADQRLSSQAAPTPDALLPQDDREVISAAMRHPYSFCAQPSLQGRTIETGSFARLAHHVPADAGSIAARFLSRLYDLRQTIDAIHTLLETDTAARDAVTGVRLDTGLAYGAAETARGRLYHIAQVAADGRITDYRIIAPTEWNFSPCGPFAAAVKRETSPGQDVIERLVELFDPCVEVNLAVRVAQHA